MVCSISASPTDHRRYTTYSDLYFKRKNRYNYQILSTSTSLHRYAGIASALTVLLWLFASRSPIVSAVECEGKPYGYPGCPLQGGSSSATVSETCGNGEREPTEECDDGSQYNGKQGRQCDASCHRRYCGDGDLDADLGEECEPQTEDVYVRDPRTNQLTVESRFTGPTCGTYCAPPGGGQKGCKVKFLSACASSAGNVAGPEAAKQTAVPASSSASPAAVTAAPSPSSSSSPQPAVCGNGRVEQDEQCDDGNQIAADRCTPACRLPICGDGIVQIAELCDDGNAVNTDSCTNACQRARCGDGVVQAGELCDDGNDINTDGCTTLCRTALCGDGIIQAGEQCDDGNQIAVDSCTALCQLPACGDGLVQPGEQCDDKNGVNEDSCTNACQRSRCGDGFKQPGEECDDGNDSNVDACSDSCRLPFCGNGRLEAGEQCDDGNKIAGDACTNVCSLPRCGDGVLQTEEECDMGERNSDALANACRMDCSAHHCGDGVVDSGEECDPAGQAGSTEDCRDDCTFSSVVVSRDGKTNDGGTLFGSLLLSSLALTATFLFVLRNYWLAPLKVLWKKHQGLDDIPLDQIEGPWHKW